MMGKLQIPIIHLPPLLIFAMKNNIPTHKGFTLLEVLVTIAVSTLLFVTVSNLMVNFTQTNTQIQTDMVNNDEKEIVYQMIKNAVDEGEKIIYQDSTNVDRHSFLLLNKEDSSALPFTLITTIDSQKQYAENGGNIYNLAIKNMVYTKDGENWTFTGSLIPRTENNYTIDYFQNRIIKGTISSENPPYCDSNNSITNNNNCILVGYKNNTLVLGKTAFAPFVSIKKPTDLRINGNDLYILSPYENREYHIDLTTYEITTTDKTIKTIFPYRYEGINIIDFMKVVSDENKTWILNTSIDITPFIDNNFLQNAVQNSLGITKLQLVRDAYDSSGSSYHIARIFFTVVNPLFNKEKDTAYNYPGNSEKPTNESSFYLFKTFTK